MGHYLKYQEGTIVETIIASFFKALAPFALLAYMGWLGYATVENTHRVIVVETSMKYIGEDVSELKKDVSGLKEDVRVLKEDMRVVKEDVRVLKEDMRVVKEVLLEIYHRDD